MHFGYEGFINGKKHVLLLTFTTPVAITKRFSPVTILEWTGPLNRGSNLWWNYATVPKIKGNTLPLTNVEVDGMIDWNLEQDFPLP